MLALRGSASDSDDLENQIIAGGGSNTMSTSHFRNVSDDGGSVGRHTDMTDIELSLKESYSYRHSPFQKLDGSIDSILVMNILVYLSATELSVLGRTNRYFARVSRAPALWSTLYRRDFTLDDLPEHSDSVSQVSLRPTLHSAITVQSAAVTAYSKALYTRRYEEYNLRLNRSKEETLQVQAEALRSARVYTIENILDLSQVRLIMPLSIGCVLLTIILFCQKVDGLNISYWMCFIPLLVALLYAFLSFRVVQVVHQHNYSSTHILRGLWLNFRSPLVFVYQEMLGLQTSALYGILALLVLCILQVMLIATKLSPSTPPDIRNHYLPWGVVFIPIWIFFALYCALPIAFRNIDPGAFVASIMLLYIPLLVFFVCLAVKMTGVQHHSGHRRIRLALMLIPFWILQALILLGSLFFLVAGIHRYVVASALHVLFVVMQSSSILMDVIQIQGTAVAWIRFASTCLSLQCAG